MQETSFIEGRQFGLDWLRIGAFGLLIFYHIGMFFVPWGWHVTTAEPVEWLQWPMMAVNPWRLSLLFLISGVVSRSLMTKLSRPGRFAASRSVRLLIPLAAGMVFFVMPQPWFELQDQGAYSQGLLFFWLNDYFEFGATRGTPLPTWNHLWFVVYLWVYSIALAAGAALPAPVRARLQSAFDGLFSSCRLFALPIGWLVCARTLLLPQFGETHALLDDPYSHAIYGFAFYFGVALARSDRAWESIITNWKPMLATAGLACGVMFAAHSNGADTGFGDLLEVTARSTLAWSAILGLLGFAQMHLHRDNSIRRYLTEAIFPYYIAHQTIIIATGYYLKQINAGTAVEFFGILLTTLVGCAVTYEVARRINWLRPILGLKRRKKLQSLSDGGGLLVQGR